LNSQIPNHERLRSNSDACPDNIWGWPSYGLREIWHSLGRGQIDNAVRVAAQVFGEPVLADTYTPRAIDVYNSVDREARRIGWGRISRYGLAHAIRKTDDNRYVVAYTQINQRQEVVKGLIIARFVHVAVGYPGIQFLADLQEYRDRSKDFQRVVNAYENHHHIYDHLARHGGVVMVRGRGIVASRVIQRLAEVRVQNPNVRILHVLRSPLVQGHRDGRARRKVEYHTEMQPFNWPKSCAGGTLRKKLEQADDQQRDRLLNDWGGTTTAIRKDWRSIIRNGLREGWYQILFYKVKRVERNQYGQIAALISTNDPRQPETWLPCDFIIDCTGLEAALDSNVLLKDMVDMYKLGRNPKGRLRVGNDYEVLGMVNGNGHVYTSGAMTLGGPYAMADSFIGLQFAAMRSAEALRKLGAPGLRGFGPLRSFGQWMRWARGVHP
jgi:pSer/pThr/pTyr-binding forkhead associated (FHA) protein